MWSTPPCCRSRRKGGVIFLIYAQFFSIQHPAHVFSKKFLFNLRINIGQNPAAPPSPTDAPMA